VRLADAEDDGRTLYVLIKGEDRRQIDGAVADVLAFEAAMTMLMPEPEPEPFVIGGAKWSLRVGWRCLQALGVCGCPASIVAASVVLSTRPWR